MDWSNEIYVRVYTRETDDDLALSWEARALWSAMLTKFDRSGIIATKRGARGLAALVRIPPNVVEGALPELLADGRLHEVDGGYLAPNFTEAQNASKSDRLRQRESRDMARARKLMDVTIRDSIVTNRDADVTNRDETGSALLVSVTDRHEMSRDVTLSLAVHSKAEQSESGAPARARSSQQGPEPDTHRPLEPSPEAIAQAPTPAISAPIAQASVARMGAAAAVSSAPAALVDPARDRWCTTLWDELNAHRARIAAKHGLEARALHPQDDGRRELAMRAREGYTRADLAHVIAVIAAEADETRSLKWLGGGMFAKRRVDNALARTVADAKSSAPTSRVGGDGMQPMPGPPRGDEPELPDRSGDPIWQQGPGDQSPEGKAARAAARAIKLAALIAKTEADRASSVPMNLGGDS